MLGRWRQSNGLSRLRGILWQGTWLGPGARPVSVTLRCGARSHGAGRRRRSAIVALGRRPVSRGLLRLGRHRHCWRHRIDLAGNLRLPRPCGRCHSGGLARTLPSPSRQNLLDHVIVGALQHREDLGGIDGFAARIECRSGRACAIRSRSCGEANLLAAIVAS